ncbi:MAG TPA: hypothetical protein VML55_04840, partial [Planctomycetaceae bacterium]|nr:hypothetical protein [Planctomycetaceae bacterium]
MPVSRTGESTPRSDRRGRVRLIAAACWLAAFSGWFYHFGLPNNPPISRPDFWWIVPDRLIDLADPPSAQDGSAWAHLPQRFDVFLLAGLIVAAAWGLGNLVLAAVRPPLDERCAERTVFAFGCGISLLTLLTLGCGLAGWLSRAVLGSLVVLGIIG